jgi:exodeoxyribonuclease-3
MRVATYNINGMKARGDYLAHWLRAVSPDVVGLQELKMTDEQFPHDAVEKLGYRATTFGQKSWNGVAVLSRGPAEVVQRGLPGQEDQGARLLTVHVGGIHFTTIYCPNGKSIDHEDFPRKLAWLDGLARHFEEKHDPSEPHVVCGDFNIVPAPIDTYAEDHMGGIFHTPAERARLSRLFDWGLHDLWRELRPEDPGFSWWDYRAGAFHKHMGLRIDLVLGTAPIRERAKAAALDRAWRKKVEGLIPSDHTPVWIDLD